MSKEILLSICIPTLNRHKYLDMLLDSICKQLYNNSYKNIEINILDDSIEDKSQDVVNKYIALCNAHINYKRNYKNKGLENAIFSLVAMSSGDYCWIVSDDDMIAHKAIAIILQNLKFHENDLIIGDRNFFNDINNWNIEKQFKLVDETFINNKDYNKIIEKIYFPFTYICSGIFSKQLWEKGEKNDVNYKYFPHMRRIFSVLPYSTKKTKILASAIMDTRAYNFSYLNNCLLTFHYYLFNVLNSLTMYNISTIRNVTKICQKNFSDMLKLKSLLSLKAITAQDNQKPITYDVYKKIRKNIGIMEKINMLFAIMLPNEIVNYCYKHKELNIISCIKKIKIILKNKIKKILIYIVNVIKTKPIIALIAKKILHYLPWLQIKIKKIMINNYTIETKKFKYNKKALTKYEYNILKKLTSNNNTKK